MFLKTWTFFKMFKNLKKKSSPFIRLEICSVTDFTDEICFSKLSKSWIVEYLSNTLNITHFLLSLYEIWGNYWFRFHVLGHFMTKTMIWAKTKITSVMRRWRWKLESWNFGSLGLLGQFDAPHTKNFELQVSLSYP
jgi:hypothetical protein